MSTMLTRIVGWKAVVANAMKKKIKRCAYRHVDGGRCHKPPMKPTLYCKEHQTIRK